MRARSTRLVLWVAIAWTWHASIARAHPGIDRARALVEDADFAGALSALAELEASGALTRAELVSLLDVRAAAQFALGADDGLRATLLALVSLEPTYRMAPVAPPALRNELDRARARVAGPIRAHARAEATDRGWIVRAGAGDDPAGLAREIRIHARRDDGAAWSEHRGDSLAIDAPSSASLRFYAVVVGPGGAPIASAGSRESPLVASRALATAGSGEPPSAGLGATGWIAIGGGAALLVAAAVVTLVVVSNGARDTRVDPPVFE